MIINWGNAAKAQNHNSLNGVVFVTYVYVDPVVVTYVEFIFLESPITEAVMMDSPIAEAFMLDNSTDIRAVT
ncbi:MAG: hypothetical protein KC517_09265 [Bacteroidetes bacterium]|nr:hypothetical protein [Bacteroidota bacterium]